MIFASTFFLNSGIEAFSLNLYPYIHNPCNVLSKRADSLKCVKIPDISTMDILRQKPNINMRMCSASFFESTGRRVQRVLWLCINMFFYRHCPKYNWVFARKSGIFHPFTSRAQHLLTVTSHTQVIKEILKPSGYWINLGPLQYHWYEFGMNATGTGLDSRYQESIELSYDELKQAILKLDFTFLHEEVGRSCHYNALNKMKSKCTIVFFSRFKNEPQQQFYYKSDPEYPGCAPPGDEPHAYGAWVCMLVFSAFFVFIVMVSMLFALSAMAMLEVAFNCIAVCTSASHLWKR